MALGGDVSRLIAASMRSKRARMAALSMTSGLALFGCLSCESSEELALRRRLRYLPAPLRGDLLRLL